MSIDIRPIEGPFGVEVVNIASADLGNPKVRQTLLKAWLEFGLLIFREAKGAELLIELSRIFGPVELHPHEGSRSREHPELIDIKYEPGAGDLYEIDGELRGIFLPWHSDLIYTDRINHGGILRPVRLPAIGGQTGFLDQIKLYETLPEHLKAEIEHLNVIYRADFLVENARFARLPPIKRMRHSEATLKVQAQSREAPRVLHPMVFKQKETHRKVLNVSPWFAVAIEGRENEAGERLLTAVIDHCLRSKDAYFHNWQIDDMVLWDNWRMLHCVCSIPAEETRWMQRSTIAGDYSLGRLEKSSDRLSDSLRISV